jgi:hypothetical protein
MPPLRCFGVRRLAFRWHLVLCPGNTRTKSGDLLEDRICRRGPDERATGTIVMPHERIDLLDEVMHAGEGSPAPP